MDIDGDDQDSGNGRNGVVAAVFAGGRAIIGDGGHPSGIRKQRRSGRVALTRLGLTGDDIVDLRYHGGPERAVNVFPSEYYALIRQFFPEADEPFEAGGFGENISSEGLRDAAVCIGDAYQVGSAVIQVSQPRSPCWKLNARFGIDMLSRVVQDQRTTGWYARVLQTGEIQTGDAMRLVGRDPQSCTIAAFWDAVLAKQADPQQLDGLSRIAGLAPDWRKKLEQRALWLRKNG